MDELLCETDDEASSEEYEIIHTTAWKGEKMGKVTIKFKDGMEIEAEQNGSSLITDSKPEFPTDLSEVIVRGEREERTVEYAELIECASIDGRYWFSFIEVPESIRATKQILADVDYLALETGVEL